MSALATCPSQRKATVGLKTGTATTCRAGLLRLGVVDACLLDSALRLVEIPTSYYLATGEEGEESARVNRPPGNTVISVIDGAPNSCLGQGAA